MSVLSEYPMWSRRSIRHKAHSYATQITATPHTMQRGGWSLECANLVIGVDYLVHDVNDTLVDIARHVIPKWQA